MRTAAAGELRVVLDTNVYISAFTHPAGPPFRIWQAAVRRRFRLFTSPVIVREMARVLREDFHWYEDAIVRQLKLLVGTAEIVAPMTSLQVILDDPDDDHVLECALEAAADLIVSGDQHLRRLKSFRGIGIVTPVNFLRTLGETK